MIKSEDRFYMISGAGVMPDRDGDLFQFNIVDWDQRRVFVVFGIFGPRHRFFEEEGEYMARIYDTLRSTVGKLSSEVWALELDTELRTAVPAVAMPPMGDSRHAPNFPRIVDCQTLLGAKIVRRSQLVETERIFALVDRCSYLNGTGDQIDVVAKYYFLQGQRERIWDELNLWRKLPSHPFIAGFDRVIVDDLEDRVVGFTTRYISGGNMLGDRRKRFKLKWLKQLTSVIDDLNLKYGVIHQDIHPRNILIDPQTESLKLIDFNFSGRIGTRAQRKGREDTTGLVFTLYEIITKDESFRSHCFIYPSADEVLKLDRWEPHAEVALDHDVSVYRDYVDLWLASRNKLEPIKHHSECPQDVGEAPALPKSSYSVDENGYELVWETDSNRVMSLVPNLKSERSNVYWGDVDGHAKSTLPCIEWERPAQDRLVEGTKYLMTGKPLVGELHPVDS